jgi:hypothetical protein
MNVLHSLHHQSPNRRARPAATSHSDDAAKMSVLVLTRVDRADAPTFVSPSASAKATAAATLRNDTKSSLSTTPPRSHGQQFPARVAAAATTTTTPIAPGSKLGNLTSPRSLHLLFKRSTSHSRRHQYQSVGDTSVASWGNDDDDDDGNDDDDAACTGVGEAATGSPQRVRDDVRRDGEGRGTTAPPPASPSKQRKNRRIPTTATSNVMDGSDSLTDEGYDGFAAGSWHSQQTQRQQQQAAKTSELAPASPQSVIIFDGLAAGSPSTPYSRRRPRRSSMPVMGGAGRLEPDTSSPPTKSSPPGAVVSCNWTDPARRTVWITSPGSARPHLEFNPESFLVGEEAGDDNVRELTHSGADQCEVKGEQRAQLNRGSNSSREEDCHDGPDRSGVTHATSVSIVPGRRRLHQRRHSSSGIGGVGKGGSGGSGPAFGLESRQRRDAPAEEEEATASPAAFSDGAEGNASWSSWHTPTPPEDSGPVPTASNFPSDAASPAPAPSSSSLSSPRRKTRRAAVGRHISSRRQVRTSSSSSSPSSMLLQHLQVPVV